MELVHYCDYERPRSRRLIVVGAAIAAIVSGCRVTDFPIWELQSEPGACEVEAAKGITYYNGPDSDTYRNSLDIYFPRSRRDCPVVVVVHGGAWVVGDNRACGLYSSIGEFLARRGMVAVLPNYRLSPTVRHPEHVKDLARAVAWTHAHVEKFGGRPDRIFLLGHSAGGHLVSLLVTDGRFLRAEGLSTSDIAGVIGVSGVYRIPPGKVEVTLGGESPQAFRCSMMIPLRSPSETRQRAGLGIPVSLNVFGVAFGDDPCVRRDASPVHHVHPGLPPFLLFYAENDLPLLPAMAEDFHRALRACECESQLVFVPRRNHNSIMFHACQPDDPVGEMILDFVRRRSCVKE